MRLEHPPPAIADGARARDLRRHRAEVMGTSRGVARRLRLDIPRNFPRLQLVSRPSNLVVDFLQSEKLPHLLRQGETALFRVQFVRAGAKPIEELCRRTRSVRIAALQLTAAPQLSAVVRLTRRVPARGATQRTCGSSGAWQETAPVGCSRGGARRRHTPSRAADSLPSSRASRVSRKVAIARVAATVFVVEKEEGLLYDRHLMSVIRLQSRSITSRMRNCASRSCASGGTALVRADGLPPAEIRDVLAGAASGEAEAVRAPPTARRRHAPCAGQGTAIAARRGWEERGRARGEDGRGATGSARDEPLVR